MKQVLIIDGVDFTPYLLNSGIDWKRNDLDAEASGRSTMDGVMHRARIAIKYTAEVSLIDIDQATSERLQTAIEPQFVEVTCWHPRYGLTTLIMYSNNVLSRLKTATDSDNLWTGMHFPLIER